MKKFMSLVMITILLIGCSSHVEVPDLIDVDAVSASEIIVKAGLIPIVSYQEVIEREDSIVLDIDPPISQKVEKNTRVNLVVSRKLNLNSNQSYVATSAEYDSPGLFMIESARVDNENLIIAVSEQSNPAFSMAGWFSIVSIISIKDGFYYGVDDNLYSKYSALKKYYMQEPYPEFNWVIMIPLSDLEGMIPKEIVVKAFFTRSDSVNIDIFEKMRIPKIQEIYITLVLVWE